MHKRFYVSPFFMKNVDPIRHKIDLVRWLLEFIRYVNASGEYCLIRHEDSEIEVIITVEKMKRIFFCVSEEKIHTFQFPFSLSRGDQDKMFAIFYKDIHINNKMITVFFALLENIEDLRISLDSTLDLVIDTLVEFDVPTKEHSYYWKVLIFLLEFESGYLRYDIDIKRCSDLHPLHHLDINYESGGTFKLGLNNKICREGLNDILDTASAAWNVALK